jgi:hypothetical protein
MWYQGEEDSALNPRRCLMPVPIICLDEQLREFAERFRQEFSKPLVERLQHFAPHTRTKDLVEPINSG